MRIGRIVRRRLILYVRRRRERVGRRRDMRLMLTSFLVTSRGHHWQMDDMTGRSSLGSYGR